VPVRREVIIKFIFVLKWRHVLSKALTLVAHVHGTVVIGNVATIVTVGEVDVHTSHVFTEDVTRDGVASVVVILSVVPAAVVLLEVFVGAVITVHGAIVVIAHSFALGIVLILIIFIVPFVVTVGVVEGRLEVVELCRDNIVPFF